MTERERTHRHPPHSRAAAGACRIGVALVAAAAVLVGCSQAADRAGGEPPAPRPTPSVSDPRTTVPPIVDPPAGSESDGLVNLPIAESAASLLVPSYRYDSSDDAEADRSLLLLQLADQEVIEITDYAEFGAVAFSNDGDAVWATGDRSLGVRDAATGATATIRIPDDIDGTLGPSGFWPVVEAVADHIAVTVDAADDPNARTMLFSTDGALRCAGPKGTALAVHGGLLWSDDARTRLDPATCALGDGLDVPAGRDVEALHVDGTAAYVIVSEVVDLDRHVYLGTVHRFDVATGERTAVSTAIPADAPEMIVQGDELWILSDHQVRRLDATTLEPVAVTDLPNDIVECDGWPYFLRQADSLYLLDDCTAVLYSLDPTTALPQKGWRLPSDEFSDIEIQAIPTEEGIWMVDHEQTVVPYLFDGVEQRFERLPFDESVTEHILALDLAVHTPPPAPRRQSPAPSTSSLAELAALGTSRASDRAG